MGFEGLLLPLSSAAALEAVVCNPFETAVTRRQLAPRDARIPLVARGALVSGLLPQLLGIAPIMTYRLATSSTAQTLSIPSPLLGMALGICEAPILLPFEWAKINMQRTHKGSPPSFITAIETIKSKSAGHIGCAFSAVAIRQGIYGISAFAAYDVFYNCLREYEDEPLWGFRKLLAGIGTGCIAAMVGQPFDLAKCKILAADDPQRVHHVLGQIVKEEGPFALFRGLSARLWRVSIGTFVFLGAYEYAFNA